VGERGGKIMYRLAAKEGENKGDSFTDRDDPCIRLRKIRVSRGREKKSDERGKGRERGKSVKTRTWQPVLSRAFAFLPEKNGDHRSACEGKDSFQSGGGRRGKKKGEGVPRRREEGI